jgi:hypothetical protein
MQIGGEDIEKSYHEYGVGKTIKKKHKYEKTPFHASSLGMG